MNLGKIFQAAGAWLKSAHQASLQRAQQEFPEIISTAPFYFFPVEGGRNTSLLVVQHTAHETDGGSGLYHIYRETRTTRFPDDNPAARELHDLFDTVPDTAERYLRREEEQRERLDPALTYSREEVQRRLSEIITNFAARTQQQPVRYFQREPGRAA